MSKALIEFKRAYEEMVRIKNEAMISFIKNHFLIYITAQEPHSSIPDEILRSLDINSRAQLRMVVFSTKFDDKVKPIIFPHIDFSQPQDFNPQIFKNPHNLPVSKINEFVDELKDLIEHYIEETKNERGTLDCVVDFFKACMNFMVRLLTFNYYHTFFDTTTGRLEEVKRLQEKMLSSYQQLSSEEQTAEFRPSLNNANKLEIVL